MTIDLKELEEKRKRATHRVAALSIIIAGLSTELFRWLSIENEEADEIFIDYPYFTLDTHRANVLITVHQILAQKKPYDVLVTFGVPCARIALEVLRKQENPPHLVMTATGNPQQLGITKSDTFVTGVEMYPYDPQEEMKFLHTCKPTMKRALLLYNDKKVINAPWWHDFCALPARAYLEAQGVEVAFVSVASTGDAYNAVVKFIPEVDTVILLEGCIGLDLYGAIGYLCCEAGITLFAGLEVAVRNSAAIGFGTDAELFGRATARRVQELLFEKKHPSELPTKWLETDRKPIMNLALVSKQGLDPEHLKKVCKSEKNVLLLNSVE